MSLGSMKSKQYPDVVSVVNLKGGVGKTTLCVNLAYGLAYFHNQRVLLVDLDPQANATQYLLPQQTYRSVYLVEPPKKKSVFELYRAFEELDLAAAAAVPALPDPSVYLQRIYKGSKGYLDLVASKLQLSLLAFQGGQVQKNSQVRWLIEAVRDRYDYVLIDAPPTVSRMLMAAFEASEHVLIPVKPDFLSSIGLPLLHRVIEKEYMTEIARRPVWMQSLKVLGLVFTMYDKRLKMTIESETDIRKVAATMSAPVFMSTISDSTKFAWSSQKSLPIFRTEPRSRYAIEVADLASEFLAKFEPVEVDHES